MLIITATTCYGQEKWGPNLEEFQSRFDPKVGHEDGPQRLKNLYFTYLVELRALAKAAPYLEQVGELMRNIMGCSFAFFLYKI